MAELMKPSLEQCKEAMRNASGNISTALATLMLACQLQVAQAQTTPTSPSTSASAAADKGGGQVVNIDGVSYTFAKIAGMDSSERKRLQILKKLGEMGKLKEYQEWSSNEVEAANQTESKIDKNIQAANQLNEGKREQLISKYEEYIGNIERGARGDRSIVKQIATADISPEELKARANALLKRRDIILAGI